MGRPRLIILIRHAQSEGNKNREIHQTVPDHRVKLTTEGWRQAQEAGRKLRSLLRPDDTLHFFTSPYRRTRETTEGILSTLTDNNPSPSPFPRHTIKVYEEPRLREQDFGNFQPSSTEMARMWHERAAYGHFFYRIPNGESAADTYDRISGFNESLWRSFGEDDFASICVLVTHGLATRVFLMRWYHWSVEYFEDLRNMNHCEFVVMRKNQDNGKYVLQNKMRTWTEWKREKAAAEAGAGAGAGAGRAGSPIPMRKRWEDARSGDDEEEEKRLPQRQNTVELFLDDDDSSRSKSRPKSRQIVENACEATDDPRGRTAPLDVIGHDSSAKDWSVKTQKQRKADRVAALKGRDGGGTESGMSGDDDTEREDSPPGKPSRSMALAMQGKLRSGRRPSLQQMQEGGMDMTAMADALGDQSETENVTCRTKHQEVEEEEFQRIKDQEQSFESSVR